MALSIAVAAPRSARAEHGAVIVTGKAKAHERELVSGAISDTLVQAGWTILDQPFSAKQLSDIAKCLERDRPWLCVEPTAHDRKVERMVVAEVEPTPGGGLKIIEQVLLPGDGVPSLEPRFCQPCGDADLRSSASELTTMLLERAVARAGNTSIAVSSTPPGAVIMLDGQMAGTTNATINTSPGTHTIILQHSGFQPAERPVTVTEGQTATVAVEMMSAEQGSHPVTGVNPVVHDDTGPHRSYVLPVVVTGVGVVALGVGIALQATVDPSNSFSQSSRLYSAPGIASMAAGAVLVGVGVYLFARHPHASSSPTAMTVPGGGVVGWTRSF